MTTRFFTLCRAVVPGPDLTAFETAPTTAKSVPQPVHHRISPDQKQRHLLIQSKLPFLEITLLYTHQEPQ